MMTDLSFSPNPRQAVEFLLSLQDEEALETALAAAEPGTAAQAVAAAPALEQKTGLLWAMDDLQRREVLDLLPPALVGALVQNLEEDNRYLLGDLSLAQFRALLSLCSAERKFYWITTALSFTDARANALPLLLSTRELVEILMTRAEFEEHLRAIGDYPVEDARLPPEALADPAQAILDLVGPSQFLRQFPVQDEALAQVLQTLLDYDPERYVDLIREGLRAADYAENHPLEWETLTEDPVLLQHLNLPSDEGMEAAEEEEGEPVMGAEAVPPMALVPVGAPPLVRLAAALPPARRWSVAEELQELYIRQAVAEGGSFHLADLERVARSVEAYLILGLRSEGEGDAAREAAVLASRPLRKVSHTGAVLVESLRQLALRLRPLESILSPEQRALARSLSSPKLTLGPEGNPVFMLLPGGSLPERLDFNGAGTLLHETAAWVAVARALGIERTAKALVRAGSVERLLEELTAGAVLYGRVELELAEPGDFERFAARYLPRGRPSRLPDASTALRTAVRAWSAEVDPRLVLPLLESALERLAERQE